VSGGPPTPDPLAAAPAQSTSIGTPTAGRLDGGLLLPLEAAGLTFLPSKDPKSRYGTVELVQGLVRAAARVERDDPGAPVTVGDLARAEGGPIPSHASHRSGRDVDVLFYLLHDDGRPFLPSKFIPLDPEGRGTDYGDLADPSDDVPVRLDVARTWRFVAALLADEAAAVQSILVVEHVRTLLLAEARRVGAEAAIVERFAEVTCQPRFPHDDHMHIRVFCSAEDIAGGCEDTRPIYPWRRRALKTAGVAPVLAGSTPATEDTEAPKPRPKLKTIEQARAEAGPMHDDVRAFLDRREAWARKPHPGRRYCR
ncbi:MAG: penicillin-insensitive murein endopeptidase, partial [Myxococcales bacterium]|nr:penicillin-insensitive murein endopeptidase [Myxococcales bacterium]